MVKEWNSKIPGYRENQKCICKHNWVSDVPWQ